MLPLPTSEVFILYVNLAEAAGHMTYVAKRRYGEMEGETKRYRGTATQRDTAIHRETPRDTEIPRDTGRHSDRKREMTVISCDLIYLFLSLILSLVSIPPIPPSYAPVYSPTSGTISPSSTWRTTMTLMRKKEMVHRGGGGGGAGEVTTTTTMVMVMVMVIVMVVIWMREGKGKGELAETGGAGGG